MVALPKTHELVGSLNRVWELVADDEMDLDVLEDTLVSLEEALEQKMEGLAYIKKSLDGEAAFIKLEEERLEKRRKAVENRSARLKKYMEDALKTAKLDKVKTPTITVSLRKSTAVEIVDETAIPDTYKNTKTVTTVDKKALGEVMKNDFDVPGAKLVHNQSLQIR